MHTQQPLKGGTRSCLSWEGDLEQEKLFIGSCSVCFRDKWIKNKNLRQLQNYFTFLLHLHICVCVHVAMGGGGGR